MEHTTYTAIAAAAADRNYNMIKFKHPNWTRHPHNNILQYTTTHLKHYYSTVTLTQYIYHPPVGQLVKLVTRPNWQ